MSLKSIILAGLVFGSLASVPASGEPANTAKTAGSQQDVLGAWRFQTKPYRGGQCVMSGTMHLSETGKSGRLNCELTAMEACSLWGRSLVRQTCEAERFGNQLSVRSKIAEVLEVKSGLDGFELNYVPDNFALTVQSGERMYGSLVSAVTAPAEFRRDSQGVS